MPKMKTHSGAAKRFKKTAKGKYKRGAAFKSHILTKMTPKAKRQLRGSKVVSDADTPRIARMLKDL